VSLIVLYSIHPWSLLISKDSVFLCIISRSGPCKIRLVHAPSVSVAVRGFKVAGILFLNTHVKPYIA
jgi:hypothetical protein